MACVIFFSKTNNPGKEENVSSWDISRTEILFKHLITKIEKVNIQDTEIWFRDPCWRLKEIFNAYILRLGHRRLHSWILAERTKPEPLVAVTHHSAYFKISWLWSYEMDGWKINYEICYHTLAHRLRKRNPEKDTKHNFVTLWMYYELKWFNTKNTGCTMKCRTQKQLRDVLNETNWKTQVFKHS